MKKRLLKLLGSLALFVIGFGLTVAIVLAVKKKFGNRSTTTSTVDVLNTPGLSVGDNIDLPDLSTIAGQTISLNRSSEDYPLCAIFTTECPGCARDSEMWKDLSAEAAKRKVAFYVMSLDDDKARIERFSKAYGFDDLPVLFDPDKRLGRVLKISFVPQYLLVTSKGRVIGRWNGVQNYDARKHETWRLDYFFQPIGSN